MKNRCTIVIIVFICSYLFSCAGSDKADEQQVLARVYDDYLYSDDIKDLFDSNTSPEDSLELLAIYVDEWVKNTLLTKKAELNLTDEQKNIDRQIKDYKSTLLIHKYQQAYINQKLDTIITEKELIDHYQQHAAEFRLANKVIKALYIRIPKILYGSNRIKKYTPPRNEEDIDNLKRICIEDGIDFDDFNNDWVYYDNLLKIVPLKVEEEKSYKKHKKYMEVFEGMYVHLIYIIEQKDIGDTSPLIFVKNKLKSIILNKRKIELVKNLEISLYKKALNHKNVELFY